MWINNVHYVWDARHFFDTTQEFFKTSALFIKKSDFFLRKHVKNSVFFHAFYFFQTSNTFLDRFPVSESSTQPTVVDVVLTCTFCFIFYSISSLLFRTNKQDNRIVSSSITHKIICLICKFYSLLKVNYVDTITFCEDVFRHLRVPATSLVTKVHTSLKKLFH